ncbi:MAG: PadR family transcriptional regulator [Humibacter sp.]
MSVRQSLLAILDQDACYGYQLRAEFDRRTGSTWPLNVGQVYNTLDRLERDGLVENAGADDQGHVFYAITESGRAEVRSWLSSPVERTPSAARDELVVKLALAATLPGVDVARVIQVQRAATMAVLQDLTRAKRAADDPADATEIAGSLVLDSLVFQAEAELRWLDHVEGSLAGFADQARRGVPVDTQKPKRGRPSRARGGTALAAKL